MIRGLFPLGNDVTEASTGELPAGGIGEPGGHVLCVCVGCFAYSYGEIAFK